MAMNYHDPNLRSYSRPVIGEPEQDPLTLYIRNIPLSLTTDDLGELLSQGRRKITKVSFLDSTGYQSSTGFVLFENEDEAAGAMNAFNNKHPLNLQIKFADKNKKTKSSSFVPQNNLENGYHSQNASLPNGLGHYRNRNSSEYVDSHEDFQNRMQKLGGRMKTLTLDTELKDLSLKITIDQGSRRSFVSSNFPDLIPNKYYNCQFCKTPALLACSLCERPYCSTKCQKEDWNSHKSSCKSEGFATCLGENGVQDRLVEASNANVSHVVHRSPQTSSNVRNNLIQSSAEPSGRNERVPPEPESHATNQDRRSFNSPNDLDRNSAEPSGQNGRLSPGVSKSQVERPFGGANQNRHPRNDRKSFTGSSHLDNKHQANDDHQKKFNGRGRVQNRDQQPNTERNQPKREYIQDTHIKTLILNKKVIEKVSVCHVINPSKFFIHLESASRIIGEMRRKMQQSVEMKPLQFVNKDTVYSTDARGQLERIKIVEVKGEQSIAYFYETGATECINNNRVYYLPPMFREFSAQAISCTCDEDIKSSETEWSENEVQIFKKGAADKLFTMNIAQHHNSVYTVSLVNEIGIPLHAMLQKSQVSSSDSLQSQSILNEILDYESLGSEVPSIMKSLKEGSNTRFIRQFNEDNRFWGLLDDGSLEQTMATIHNELKQTKEDITMSCEVGDIGVAFSAQYQTFYRCKIQKRLKEKIGVFYIEYGNTEQIDKVFLASPALLSAKCHLFTCTLSPEVNAAVLDKEAVIKSVKNNLVELAFGTVLIQFQPWDEYLSTYKQSPPKVEQKASQVVAKSPEKPKFTRELEAQKHCHFSTLEKSTIPVGKARDVKPMYVEADVLFVSLASLEADMAKLASELLHADGFASLAALPRVDDVVCAKYSDGIYYRAKIKAICDNQTCVVSFIDYGNDDKVHLGSMKVLPQALCSYPIFAIPIKVDADIASAAKREKFIVENVGSTDSGVLNCRPVERHMLPSLKIEYLPTNRETEVVCVHQENGVHFIQELSNLDYIEKFNIELQKFCRTNRLVQEPLIDELVCAMSSLDNNWCRGCVEKKVSAKTFSIRFVDYGNIEDVAQERMNNISNKLLKDPCFAIPVKAKSDSSENVILELNKKYSVIAKSLPENGVQEVKLVGQQNVVATPPEPTVKAAETCDTTEYFIQDLPILPLEAGEQKIKILSVEDTNMVAIAPDDENINANFRLAKEVTDFCKSPESSKYNDDALLKEGQLVLAEFAGDFYRACIVDGPNEEKLYEVVYFDFGNTEKLTIDKLRKMESRFMSLPSQCSPCKLIGFQAKEDKDEEIKKVLNSFAFPNYLGEVLGCVYKTDNDEVTLEIPCITKFLLEKNLVSQTST